MPQLLPAVADVQDEGLRSRMIGSVVGVQDTLDAYKQLHWPALANPPSAVVWGEGGVGAGADVDQVHYPTNSGHLRVRHHALGEGV